MLRSFARTGHNEWREVLLSDEKGVTLLGIRRSFETIWNQIEDLDPAPVHPRVQEESLRVAWSDLLLPLPDPPGSSLACWGYAMTYPSHRKEIHLNRSFLFKKNSPAMRFSEPIEFRPHLDCEAEIGLLVHRDHLSRFGYLFLNDFTDRGIQVGTYQPRDPASGFSRAKSFPGALRLGPLLAVGNEAAWEDLEVSLELNGELRQIVRARECLLRPAGMRREAFEKEKQGPWVLILTGTPKGILFRVPNLLQKSILLLTTFLSKEKAWEKWLSKNRFLLRGDQIRMFSNKLGQASTEVV